MKPNKIIFVVIGLIIVGGVIYGATRPSTPTNTNTSAVPRRCAEEAKICPDGSPVRRALPSCDFAACPNGESTEATKDWKEYSNPDLAFSIKYPPTWTITNKPGGVTVAADGVAPLTIENIEDDTIFYESQDVVAITVGGLVSNQGDYMTPTETTRMVWIPRDRTYLRVSWRLTGNNQPYYLILSTLQLQ